MQVVEDLCTKGYRDEWPLPIQYNVVHDQQVLSVGVVGAEYIRPVSNMFREALGDHGD